VFEKDDPGDSMFLVVEGLLAVLVPVEGRSEPLRVGHLGGGDFFGEMSLLTGEPRSATVCAVTDALVFEIEKPHVQELITDRPEVVRQLSRVVAERQAANLAALDRTDDDGRAPEATRLADRLFERITHFFGAGRRDA
jgi:CRP-like cAMP-binding protein